MPAGSTPMPAWRGGRAAGSRAASSPAGRPAGAPPRRWWGRSLTGRAANVEGPTAAARPPAGRPGGDRAPPGLSPSTPWKARAHASVWLQGFASVSAQPGSVGHVIPLTRHPGPAAPAALYTRCALGRRRPPRLKTRRPTGRSPGSPPLLSGR